MKSQLNRYRQYTISDYLLNNNKFKEYLQFCEKNNLRKEKKYIMENLFRTLKFKESNKNIKLFSELQRLCIIMIIFSDFEVELLFDSEDFNPELQKGVFNQIENYLNNDNSIDNNEEIIININYKYNYWILKLLNYNYINSNKVRDTILKEKEINESLEKLTNYTNIDINTFKGKNKKEKLLILKIIYELSLYYYFNNDNSNANKYLYNLINFYNEYLEAYQIGPNSKEMKLFYFDIKKIRILFNYIQKNIEKNNAIDNNVIQKEESSSFNNNINNEFFNINDIHNYENIISEDYNKYKNEVDKVNKDYNDKLLLNNENALNSFELNNKNSLVIFLKITEYLINTTLENFNYYNMSKNFIDSLNSKVELKIKNNTNRKEEIELQYIKKEVTYYDTLLQLIKSMINNDEKLHKSFLKNLSEFITNNTLTGNLTLSGLIHSNMINFSNNLKTLNNYFMEFTRFFKEKTSVYKVEIINQIGFISKIVQIFYIIMDAKNKINVPLDKEIIINIQEELCAELIYIFLYWLSPDDNFNEDNKKKEGKNSLINLKFCPSINIIYILIESLKNLDFLKIYKIIASTILEFLVNRKHLNDSENSSDLFQDIYEIKAKIFKINSFLDGIIRNIKVLIDEQIYYIDLKVHFMEFENRVKLNIKNELLNFYIKALFNIIKKIDKKINKYESLQKINERRNKKNDLNNNVTEIINEDNKENEYFENILEDKKNKFLLSFYYILEVNSFTSDKEIQTAIINGIDYFNLSMNNIKINYMKSDLMMNISKVKKSYDNFKANLNQDILFQLIFCFIKQKRFLEALILTQYTKKFVSSIAYKLLETVCEKNDFINIDSFKFIWKLVIFEYLSNYFYRNNNYDALAKIESLIKRVSNHQYFKGHPFRKNFKILNFLDFLDYLNNIKYNF